MFSRLIFLLFALGCFGIGVCAAVPAEEPRLFEPGDIKNLPRLVERLRDGLDPVSEYVRSKCDQRSLALLYTYQPGSEQVAGQARPKYIPEIQARLVDLFNSLLMDKNLYAKERFAGVKLSSKTSSLIGQPLSDSQLLGLNQMLLEQAFSSEIGLAEAPVDLQAQLVEYNKEKGVFVAQGKAMLRRGDVYLRCDLAIVNMDSGDVYAEGDVLFAQGSKEWSGEKLRYNFKTGLGDFGGFISFIPPFYVRASASSRASEKEYLFEKATITTCEGDSPVAYITGRDVSLEPGRHAEGKHVFLHVCGLPVMYSPYWRQNIGSPNFFSAVPGYNSRMSAFFLAAFNYRLSRHFETASHLDYRVRRGPGIGQDILWSSSGNAKGLSTERYMREEDEFWYFGRKVKSQNDEEIEDWFGDLTAYYTRDSWPDEGKKQKYPIDNDRYRARLFHSQNIDDRTYLLGQANYLSDPKIIEHFFRDEHKYYPEPENYLVLVHRGDNYNAGIEFEKRLNDFYSSVDKLPEASIAFTRQQIGSIPFYYEGRTAGGYLDKKFESNETKKSDYSAFRFDTDNRLYYSTKWFGFLNLTPRAGYRGTYYSSTKEMVQEIPSEDAGGSQEGEELASANKREVKASGKLRSITELGIESSFKMFKVWEAHPGGAIHNLRHLAEPYVNYTYVPEPNLLSDKLYQFDEIDALGAVHNIKLGMINKLQTRPEDSIIDLINADIWTFYRFDTKTGENSFSNICFDIRSSLPKDWMSLRFDGEFDQYETSFQSFNARFSIEDSTMWRNHLEFRYLSDSNSLIYDEFSISPFANWKYSAYLRYDFEDSELEAWGLSLERRLECITYRVAAEMEDDDYQFWVQFWFNEFPRGRVGLGV